MVIDWFFYSKKQNALLRRHRKKVNISYLEDVFLKSKYKIDYGEDAVRPAALATQMDYKLMKDTFVSTYYKRTWTRLKGPECDASSCRVSKTIDGLHMLNITHDILKCEDSNKSAYQQFIF